MITEKQFKTKQAFPWFTKPDPSHLVHFYPFDKELLDSLAEYFSNGLESGDTCIAIATPSHLASLNATLRSKGIDINAGIDAGQYIMLDANEALASFMHNEKPDYERFITSIGRVIQLAAGRDKPIRAFGEMVAILWEKGNLPGLLQLEEYWHTLVAEQSFSLYCAYPETYFDATPSNQTAMNKICSCHSMTIGISA